VKEGQLSCTEGNKNATGGRGGRTGKKGNVYFLEKRVEPSGEKGRGRFKSMVMRGGARERINKRQTMVVVDLCFRLEGVS